MFSDQLLGLGEALPQSGHSQLIFFDAQNHSIAGLDAKGTPERSGDYNPPVLINPSVTLCLFHDILYFMTYLWIMSIEANLAGAGCFVDRAIPRSNIPRR